MTMVLDPKTQTNSPNGTTGAGPDELPRQFWMRLSARQGG